MKASELIKELKKQIKEHGDLEVERDSFKYLKIITTFKHPTRSTIVVS